MAARSPRRTCLTGILAAGFLTAALLPAHAAPGLVLKRVAISTGGMAWLGFHGALDADGHVALELPADQLDDALKSLTVFGTDLKLRQITIGGHGVLADPFQGTPLVPEDLASLASLLARLRGSNVVVDDDPPVRGQIVGTSTRKAVVDGVAIDTSVLLLSTKAGLASFDLDGSTTVRLEDPDASGALLDVLERTAQARNGERRTLDVVTDAKQASPVDLGLLVAAPVWKPTWRVVLTEGHARIQGFAVVENRSGQAWNAVHLTLIDGSADSLRQDLSRVWYAPRRTVPVLQGGQVATFQAQSTLALPKALASRAAAAPRQERTSTDLPEPARLIDAAGNEAGLATTFDIPAPVDVEDGGSLMVPLLDREIAAERLAFVPAGSTGPEPQSAILIRNDTGTTLPPGIVTVMDQGTHSAAVHVGDAILPVVPAGAERRISFGLDRKINFSVAGDDQHLAQSLILQDGVLTLHISEHRERSWHFTNDDDQGRRVLVQVPAEPGAIPTTPAELKRDGDDWYVSGDLPARGETTVRLVTDRPVEERFVLSTGDTLDTILASRGLTVPEPWKPRIAAISDLAAQRAAAERQLTSIADRRAQVEAEQARVRANLEAVKEAGPLRERWLAELSRQEDQLSELEKQRDQAAERRDQADAALRTQVADLRR